MPRKAYGILGGATLMIAGMVAAQAASWAPVQGNVRLANGTPLCAMVLANGQYTFSCDGSGSYSLNVPLDANGDVNLFSFADGFSPFSTTLGPSSFPFRVEMETAAPNSPLIRLARVVECAQGVANWVHISGKVESDGIQPLCAMVLANGQQKFTCGSNLGTYDITAPVDQNGEVTIFAFADGFQPYRGVFAAPSCDGSSPRFPGFDFVLHEGDYWEYKWTDETADYTPGNDVKTFRIELGSPKYIEGVLTHTVNLSSGNYTQWKYLAQTGKRLLGSTDGTTLETIFDANEGLWYGGGFFLQPTSDQPGQATTIGVDSDISVISGPAVGVTYYRGSGDCVRTTSGWICDPNRTWDNRREYFWERIGPIGYSVSGYARQLGIYHYYAGLTASHVGDIWTFSAGPLEVNGAEAEFWATFASSGTLIAYTKGLMDTYGYVLDSEKRTLAVDDNSGDEKNFRIVQPVSAGKYYLRVRHVTAGERYTTVIMRLMLDK